MKSRFEIHAPGIDTKEILNRIEERVSSRGYDPAETERIKSLSFTPSSPGPGGFDSALTSELFEKPVPEPNFTSSKFRYLKGPLRILAAWLFRSLSLAYDKLSENKIQAFYNVVHELIALNHRYEKMRALFDRTLEDNLALRSRLELALREKTDTSSGSGQEMGEKADSAPLLEAPPLSPALETLNEKLLESLPEPGAEEGLLCLDDSWGYFAAQARARGFKNAVCSGDDYLKLAYIRRIYGYETLYASPASALAGREDESVFLIALPELERSSDDPALVLELAARKAAKNGLVCMRWNAGSPESPFTRRAVWNLDASRLSEFFAELGLEVVNENRPPELGPDSFEFILRKPG